LELAVEVALGENERELDHVEKDSEKCDLVVVAAGSPSVESYLENKLEDLDSGTSTVDVVPVRELDAEYFEQLEN
jgi:prephenate dehydrogenase